MTHTDMNLGRQVSIAITEDYVSPANPELPPVIT
jgi:hypothetical protein